LALQQVHSRSAATRNRRRRRRRNSSKDSKLHPNANRSRPSIRSHLSSNRNNKRSLPDSHSKRSVRSRNSKPNPLGSHNKPNTRNPFSNNSRNSKHNLIGRSTRSNNNVLNRSNAISARQNNCGPRNRAERTIEVVTPHPPAGQCATKTVAAAFLTTGSAPTLDAIISSASTPSLLAADIRVSSTADFGLECMIPGRTIGMTRTTST
jgi:hypothetical protein